MSSGGWFAVKKDLHNIYEYGKNNEYDGYIENIKVFKRVSVDLEKQDWFDFVENNFYIIDETNLIDWFITEINLWISFGNYPEKEDIAESALEFFKKYSDYDYLMKVKEVSELK